MIKSALIGPILKVQMEKQNIEKVLEDLRLFTHSCQVHNIDNLTFNVNTETDPLSIKIRGTNFTTGKYVEITFCGSVDCECSEAGPRNCTIHQHYEKTEI